MSQQVRNWYKDRKALLSLNGAYLLSTLGDRLWVFTIGMFTHQIGGIMYIATQQLADSIIKLIFTPIIGKILDKTNRNKGIQIALLINNFCVSISALVFAYCFHLLETTPDKKELQGHENIFLLIALIFSSMAKVASGIERMAFTKDWIVVLVQSSENSRLSAQNSIMNVLDQISAALLPLFTGILLDTFSRIVCCVFVIVYNISSWIIESRILHTVYRDTPALKRRKSVNSEEIVEVQGNVSWINSFKLYFNQKAWRPGFALAILYFTVLGFDNLVISYGAKQGLSATALGAFMTAGSICGLLGNVSYTYFERFMGLLLTAMIGFFLQNVCVMTASYSQAFLDSPLNITRYVENFELKSWPSRIISEIQSPSTRSDIIALPASQWPLSIILFFVGITFARYGLWIIDPTIIQIMQETIPERNRYRIFGVQASISEFFSMLKDILVIFFFQTEIFGALCVVSACSANLATILYFTYFIKEYPNSRKSANTATSNDTGLENMRQPLENVTDPTEL